MTLATQVEKLKRRLHLDHVVLLGDRGMITQARITADIKSAGLDWISSLRAPAIKRLVETGALQLSLLDQRDMASITAPEFPGERLVVCRNPDLTAERTRKREELLAATERDLVRIQTAVARKRDPLRGTAEIALAVGKVINKYKMAKHLDLDIADAAFSFARKTAAIAAEAATDGVYVIRTSLPAQTLDDATTVRSYKSLALVERAFRCIKTVDLHVRPVYHRLADRVRAHVFLRMLAYYLEWHMRQRLAPMLFDDTDKAAAELITALCPDDV
jgi:transposase